MKKVCTTKQVSRFIMILCLLSVFGTSNISAQNWGNIINQSINNAARIAKQAAEEKARQQEAKKRAEEEAARKRVAEEEEIAQKRAEEAKKQAEEEAKMQIVGNRNNWKKANPITSVITPHTKFTQTFIKTQVTLDYYAHNDYDYYVISYADGNLYGRKLDYNKKEYTKEQFILASVKEIYLSTVQSKYGYAYTYFAIKNDGSLWGWGDNSKGQLGDNTGINKTDPIKIMDNVKEILTGGGYICAIKNDGVMYGWGENTNGILGIGNFDNQYAPVKLAVEKVSFAYASSIPYYGQYDMGCCAPQINVVTLSGYEYILGGKASSPYKLAGTTELAGKHDYNTGFSMYNEVKGFTVNKKYHYILTPKGELYKDNELLASNVAYAGNEFSSTYSYITKNGDMYSWGDAPIGDGTNVPRKAPILVLKNVIQFKPATLFGRSFTDGYALTSDGKLYVLDKNNTFKYEFVISDVYYLLDSRENNYFTNNGCIYDYSGNIVLKDVALPQIKEANTQPNTSGNLPNNTTSSSQPRKIQTRYVIELDKVEPLYQQTNTTQLPRGAKVNYFSKSENGNQVKLDNGKYYDTEKENGSKVLIGYQDVYYYFQRSSLGIEPPVSQQTTTPQSEINLTKAEWRNDGMYVEGNYEQISELWACHCLRKDCWNTKDQKYLAWSGKTFWGTIPASHFEKGAIYEIYIAGIENGQETKSETKSVYVPKPVVSTPSNNSGSPSSGNAGTSTTSFDKKNIVYVYIINESNAVPILWFNGGHQFIAFEDKNGNGAVYSYGPVKTAERYPARMWSDTFSARNFKKGLDSGSFELKAERVKVINDYPLGDTPLWDYSKDTKVLSGNGTAKQDFDRYVKISILPNDGEKMFDAANAYLLSYPEYNLFGNQCDNMTSRIAGAGGKKYTVLSTPNWSFDNIEDTWKLNVYKAGK